MCKWNWTELALCYPFEKRCRNLPCNGALHSAAPLAQCCHGVYEEARFTFMQKSPNQYEGEQENVHSEHLDVSLPVHASKRKGPEVTQSFIFKPRRKKCIVCAPKQAAGPQTVATAETCHYQGERTVIHEAERAANWPTCSLDPAAVYLTAQTGTGRRCKQQRDASSWIFCFIRLTFKMLSAAISVAALCKNLSASVSRHICCWAAGFKIHRKTDEHMKMLSNAPPTSFIQ